MTQEQFHEVKGKLSFGGKVARLVFWGYQILMVCWLFSYWSTISGDLNVGSDATRAGAAIGSALGTGMIMFFWVTGTVIFGIPMLMTRAQKYLVKIEGASAPSVQ